MTERSSLTIREQIDRAAASAVEMQEKLGGASTAAERREYRERLKMLKDLEAWLRSRNGYE